MLRSSLFSNYAYFKTLIISGKGEKSIIMVTQFRLDYEPVTIPNLHSPWAWVSRFLVLTCEKIAILILPIRNENELPTRVIVCSIMKSVTTSVIGTYNSFIIVFICRNYYVLF